MVDNTKDSIERYKNENKKKLKFHSLSRPSDQNSLVSNDNSKKTKAISQTEYSLKSQDHPIKKLSKFKKDQ